MDMADIRCMKKSWARGLDAAFVNILFGEYISLTVPYDELLEYLPIFFFTASLAEWFRRPPRERKILGSNPAFTGIFSGSSHSSDSKIGTPVATLPGAWRYRVSAGTGRPGVSIL